MSGLTLFDILLAVGALAVLLKLRSVLGRRTGPRPGPAGKPVRARPAPVLPPAARAAQSAAPLAATPQIHERARAGLGQIARADRNFRGEVFLAGAAKAYEMVIAAFAKGDLKILGRLVSAEVLARFRQVIEERAVQQHEAGAAVCEMTGARIMEAALEDRMARIAVRFESRQISWVKDGEGRIIAGDPGQARAMSDLWTFRRDLRARDPNWQVVATAAA